MFPDGSCQPSLTGVAALPRKERRASSVLRVREQFSSRFLRTVSIGNFAQAFSQIGSHAAS
jgi:hypothetical protein